MPSVVEDNVYKVSFCNGNVSGTKCMLECSAFHHRWIFFYAILRKCLQVLEVCVLQVPSVLVVYVSICEWTVGSFSYGFTSFFIWCRPKGFGVVWSWIIQREDLWE